MTTPTPTTVQVKIQLRRDTAAAWASVNPVLLAGEAGLETDTNKIKIGNGSTAWNSLGYFPFVVSGGTVTGNLEIGTTGTLTFEGSSADNFETTLGVINPTADRTINLPNVSGTIITTGDTGTVTSTMIADGTIVNADVSASAAIAHSKLANITAGFVLIGNASNVPTATQVTGDVTISDTGVTAISSGVIIDADVSASAEIAVSKLADGAARQLLQTDAAGTGVEWTSNVDIPGTLDVTGTATFDGAVTVAGDLTVNGTTTTISTQNLLVEDKNIIIGDVATPTDATADGGGITLKGATDKTINWVDTTDAWTSSEHINIASGKEYRIDGTKVIDATSLGSNVLITSANITDGTIVNGDINASAAIAGTKISPDFGSQTVQTTGVFSHALGTAGAPTITFTGDPNTGIYSPGADQVAISTGGSGRLFVDSSGRVGIGTTSPGSILHTAENASTYIRVQRTTSGTEGNLYLGCTSSANQIISEGSSSVAKALRFDVGSTEAMRITSAGLVGIGNGNPVSTLDITGSGEPLRIQSTTASTNYITHKHNSSGDIAYLGAGGGAALGSGAPTDYAIRANQGALLFATNGNNERARIDSSGRLLVGTSTARSTLFGTYTPALQVESASVSNPNGLSIGSNTNDDNPVNLYLFKTRGTSVGSNTAVQNGDVLGNIAFAGANGTDVSNTAAWIRCVVDGTPFSSGDTTDLPGALVLSTTADGASTPTERMRILSDGNVIIGKAGQTVSYQNPGINLFSSGSADFTRASAYLISVNRKTDDGVLVEFYQDNNLEGTISVSGTTVSYNGAHLSRWSQLPSGTERTEILRGTVLSNIDEMCEWGDQENEQLNRMKVSDVEGDKNVAGVFQAWDDDDDTYTNDFYCAMTGDFIIRIAPGVTVERGDLLMSAGDGTAKPQDDDIIRSKTIAKVTSTNVSCTYEDGSYCVPCVLMAC